MTGSTVHTYIYMIYNAKQKVKKTYAKNGKR